jgi:vacuolar-type H+-ATPase subunit E/Vma4
LFKGLTEYVTKELTEPKFIANLINSFMASLEERGVKEDLVVRVPNTISPRVINSLLIRKFLQRLENESVEIGAFSGGVEIKMREQKMTIDITNTAVCELLAHYIRSDFRNLVFQT